MAIQESDSHVGMTTLVSGIVDDARQLLVQQLTLFQVEVKNDVRRILMACIPLVVSVILGLTALVTLAIAGAHFLCWYWPDLPMWAGYAISGGVLGLLASILAAWGITELKSANPLPDQTVQGLKENIQWQTKK